jgi:hypothetical protein
MSCQNSLPLLDLTKFGNFGRRTDVVIFGLSVYAPHFILSMPSTVHEVAEFSSGAVRTSSDFCIEFRFLYGFKGCGCVGGFYIHTFVLSAPLLCPTIVFQGVDCIVTFSKVINSFNHHLQLY